MVSHQAVGQGRRPSPTQRAHPPRSRARWPLPNARPSTNIISSPTMISVGHVARAVQFGPPDSAQRRQRGRVAALHVGHQPLPQNPIAVATELATPRSGIGPVGVRFRQAPRPRGGSKAATGHRPRRRSLPASLPPALFRCPQVRHQARRTRISGWQNSLARVSPSRAASWSISTDSSDSPTECATVSMAPLDPWSIGQRIPRAVQKRARGSVARSSRRLVGSGTPWPHAVSGTVSCSAAFERLSLRESATWNPVIHVERRESTRASQLDKSAVSAGSGSLCGSSDGSGGRLRSLSLMEISIYGPWYAPLRPAPGEPDRTMNGTYKL